MAEKTEQNPQTTLQVAGAQPRDVGKGTARILIDEIDSLAQQRGSGLGEAAVTE